MNTKISLGVILLAVLPVSVCAAEVQVNQTNKKFDKDQLSVKVGDGVSFLNGDSVKHNLTVVTPDEESKDLGTEAPGGAVKYVMDKPGVYDVRCNIHPTMKMKIKVE